jgi:type I restriction enzyme S subunit
MARVGDLAKQIRGVSYGKQDASKVPKPGYLPVLRAGNIGDDELLFNDLVFVSAARVSAKQKVQKGDVVIAASSGSLGVVGKAAPARADYDGGFGAFCKVLRPSSRVDPAYFAHFFRTREYRHRISRLASGANINNLRNEHLDEMLIPIPPLPEQRRIADILDKADALRTKRRTALKKLDELTQSIFLDMFGDPATNPKGWPIRAVAEYVREFQGGKSLEAEAGENITTRNRVLKVSAVTGNRYRPEESKPVPDNYSPNRAHFVRTGDLLFSRANTTELVGAVAFVGRAPANILLPDKLWRFVWRDPNHVNPLFVWSLFQTSHVRREIGRRATGTSGSMKNISQAKLLGIRTMFPPADVQRKFGDLFQSIERIRSKVEENATRNGELFASLQHRAFRGDL